LLATPLAHRFAPHIPRNTVQDNYEQRCKEFGGKVIARVPRTARDIYKYSTGGGQK